MAMSAAAGLDYCLTRSLRRATIRLICRTFTSFVRTGQPIIASVYRVVDLGMCSQHGDPPGRLPISFPFGDDSTDDDRPTSESPRFIAEEMKDCLRPSRNWCVLDDATGKTRSEGLSEHDAGQLARDLNNVTDDRD